MKNYTETEINKLQENLQLIRKAGGWSAEEFGDMIGVTKQTIRNLENKKTIMSKTQYIAIRAVLDYEMADRPEDTALISAVNICLNSDGLSDIDAKKAHAFVEGATKTGLDRSTFSAGLVALIGIVAAETIMLPITTPVFEGTASAWLAGIIKNKK